MSNRINIIGSCYRITFAMGDTTRADGRGDQEARLKPILKKCAKGFGGYTLSSANRGGYIMESTGELVEEPSYTLTVVTNFLPTGLAQEICSTFNQESVLIEEPSGKAMIFYGNK